MSKSSADAILSPVRLPISPPGRALFRHCTEPVVENCSEVGRGVPPHCFERASRSGVRQGALASCRLSRGRLASVYLDLYFVCDPDAHPKSRQRRQRYSPRTSSSCRCPRYPVAGPTPAIPQACWRCCCESCGSSTQRFPVPAKRE
jgi:hypothetical protein